MIYQRLASELLQSGSSSRLMASFRLVTHETRLVSGLPSRTASIMRLMDDIVI